ncbi:hypothetical protein Tco_1235372 [Tanacetum coccineum]
MQEFWATAIVHHQSIHLKMNNKKHIVNLEYFREMLQICPKLPDQQFEELPFEEEILTFLKDLVINKCLSGKSTGYDSLRLSQAQILWGMYHKKNVDYAYLLWEDFVYQVENKNVKRSNEMYYPHFTKVIVNFFMTKDSLIPRRNRVNWKFSKDDPMFTPIKVVSRHEDTQLYGAILPDELTNEAIKDSESYKEYYVIASRAEPPKTKASVKKKQAGSDKTKTPPTAKGKTLKTSAKAAKPAKQKQLAKTSKAKGLTVLSEVALTEAEQIKLATKRSLIQTHNSYTSGSGTDEGTGGKPGVPDVPTYESDDEQISWKSSDEEDNDEVVMNYDQNDDDDLVHPKLSTFDEKERQDDEDKEEEWSDDEGYDDENQGIDSIFNLNTESTSLIDVPVTTVVEIPLSSATTLPPPPIPLITHLLKTLENDFSEFKQTNQFAAVVSSILSVVDTYLANKMNEAIKTIVQLHSDRLRDEAQADNEDFINKLDDNIKKIIKEQVKEQVKAQVSKILPKIEKTVNEKLEAEVLTRSSNESKTSHAIVSNLSELELKKILIDKMESNKSIHIFDEQNNLYKALVDAYKSDKLILDTYRDTISFKRRQDDEDKDEEPSTGSNWGPREEEQEKNQRQPVHQRKRPPRQLASLLKGLNLITSLMTSLLKQRSQCTLPKIWKNLHIRSSIQDLLNINLSLARKQDTRDSFNKLMDTPLDFSAFVMNQLNVDTLTPELLVGLIFELMKGSCKSHRYPHDKCKPLPLIPNSQGRRVIPFDHFIKNDLEYLRGGTSSRTYATSVMKTEAAGYGHVKWFEDLVPNTMWSPVPVIYDKYALWGISHWGQKRQQFYGFAVNREYARDHLDWITVRRNNDKLYTFKEGDYKRLRLQDIEDMLLLQIQGKLTNLIIVECLALNVSLRMFTRSIVIQRRMEDLQLGVESYQKKLNLTRPDTMKYLPRTYWKKVDKDKAGAMIQAISKQLKNRRIKRSLEKFRYSNPIIQPEPEGSTQGYPLDSVEVLRDYTYFYQLSHSELVDIEKVAVCSSLRSLKPKCIVKSRAKRDHP